MAENRKRGEKINDWYSFVTIYLVGVYEVEKMNDPNNNVFFSNDDIFLFSIFLFLFFLFFDRRKDFECVEVVSIFQKLTSPFVFRESRQFDKPTRINIQ